MARLLDRSKKSGQYGGSPRLAAVTVDSSGVSEGISAAETAKILQEHVTTVEIGHPGVDEVEATAGNAAHTITVPAGKYWRLVALYHTIVTDASVANRDVVVTTRTVADATIEALTHASVAASTTAKRTTVFGSDTYSVGDRAVAAQGTLSITEPVTDTDPFVLNGVTFTCVAALTGAANEIFIGASEAATKLAFNAAFVDRDNGGVLHSVTDAVYTSLEMTAIDFATDDMVFTANVKGTLGNALATTETFTHANNVFDAATLGTTTAGLDVADIVSALDFPDAGVILTPGEDIYIIVTLGEAGDSYDTYLVYIEYDANPTP